MRNSLILGISAYYHDSAAALLRDGQILGAAQQERFSRKKHDAGFPHDAIGYCLDEAGVRLSDLDAVVFYDKPFLSFDRLLETYFSFAPKGVTSFLSSMPVWLKEKLLLKSLLRKELVQVGGCAKKQLPPLLFSEHHQAHAASAFYPSPFKEAAILCLDGVGEWATTSAWRGSDGKIEPLWQINFPDSLGLLYSAFTYFCGFKVNSGEYKLMGLAPYGEPRFAKHIQNNLMDIRPDGSFRLNQDYFSYCTETTMTSPAFDKLFGGPSRKPESPITVRELDLAASVQQVTEEIVYNLSETLRLETGLTNLCIAGGVALNCTSNGKLARTGKYESYWVQPAAGDAGGALGAALAAHYHYYGHKRKVTSPDGMQGAYLGPSFNDNQIRHLLEEQGAKFTLLGDEQLYKRCAELLDNGKILGWFQGRMEFGPRALGNRSIVGDPRAPEMQSRLNQMIKFRESFRPFAPSVLEEDAKEYFSFPGTSPYMLFVCPVSENIRKNEAVAEMQAMEGLEKLYCSRSSLPAVTHIDFSARHQTVSKQTNPRFYRLIDEFRQRTGCSVLINTSFNVRGEPIVCTPLDAYRCFMHTDMDYLVLNNYFLDKESQPKDGDFADNRSEFRLD